MTALTKTELQRIKNIVKERTKKVQSHTKYIKRCDLLLPCIGDKVMYQSTLRDGSNLKSGFGYVTNIKSYDYFSMRTLFYVEDIETKEGFEVMYNSSIYTDDIIHVVHDNGKYAVYDSLKNEIITDSIFKHKADVEDYMCHHFGTEWRNNNTIYSIRKIKISIEE